MYTVIKHKKSESCPRRTSNIYNKFLKKEQMKEHAPEYSGKNKEYESYERGLKGEKEIFNAHKDYISYELEVEIPNDKYFDRDYYTVDIGHRESISKEELKDLILKEINSYENELLAKEKRERLSLDNAKYSFRSLYDYANNDFHDKHISISKLTERAMELVKDKSYFESVIRHFANKNLSTKQYLKIFKKVYDYDKSVLLDIIIKNRFENPQSFEIKTDLAGPPSLWTEGHGRDFSYQFTPTKKHLKVYAENGAKIDTKKVYTKDEVKELMKNNDFIVVDEYALLYNGRITDFTSNISYREINETLKGSITEKMFVEDYKDFMKFYKLNKIEIGLKVKELKAYNDKKIKEYADEKAEGDKAIKILDSYDYENL